MFHKIKVCICVFILCFVNTLALAQEIKRFAPRIDYTFKLGNKRDISRLGILAPIQETKSGLLFSNIFGLYDSREDFEINLGLGYRELLGNQILGIASFLDKRRSNTGNIFTQGTFSLEYLRRYLEFRLNGYVPIGKKSKEASSVRTFSPRSYLQVSQSGFNTEKALWGLDVEVGGSLPFLESLSGHIAYYHFNDEDIKAIHGLRFRSSLKLSEYVSLEGEIARDRLRDINYLVGARVHIDIGGKTKRLTPLEHKMTQMVIRDIDIITDEVENSFEADNSKELSYKADWDQTGRFVDVSSEEAKDIKLEIDENGNIKDVDFKGRKPKGYILEEAYKRAQRLRYSSHPRRGATSISYSDIDLILDNLAISRSNALKVLGLREGASARDIKRAYRRLTLIHHPDRGGDADNFNCLQDAYNIALALNENDYNKLVNIVGKSSYKKNYTFVPEGFNQNFVEPKSSQEVFKSTKAITLTPEPISSSSISGTGMSRVYDRIEFKDSKTARLVGATKSIAIDPNYIKGIPQNLTKPQLTRFIANSRVNVSPLLDKHTNQVNGYSIDVVGRLRGGSDEKENYGNSGLDLKRSKSLIRSYVQKSIGLNTNFDKIGLTQYMHKYKIPGMSIAVFQHGFPIAIQSFGEAVINEKELINNSTIFEAASLSKPVIAYGVLKLVEKKLLDLDTPIHKYLEKKDHLADPRFNKITTKMLLSHSSGLTNKPGQQQPPKILFEPGTDFSYSGDGFEYLGKIIERLSGQPYENYMQKNVFLPLGMKDSSYVHHQDTKKTNRTLGHDKDSIHMESLMKKFKFKHPAFSLHTTIIDFANFTKNLFSNDYMLSMMTSEQIKTKKQTVFYSSESEAPFSQNISWGLGWGVQNTYKGASFWQWGKNPGYRSYFSGFLDDKSAVVIFTNSDNGMEIIPTIAERITRIHHSSFDWLNE